jgi:Plasmid pRiA4b ORF-3-like protein
MPFDMATTATVYQLKVTLRHVRPPIWRRLRVPGAVALGRLHHALQIALGWTDSHLHQFRVGDAGYGMPDPHDDWGTGTIDESNVRLEQVAKVRAKLIYEYDFGDGWEHDVLVEAVEPATDRDVLPVCLDGRRACPPEDCGGPHGYANLLESLADPKHPDHDDMKEWIGPDFAAEHFDLEQVNEELRALAARWRPRAAATRGPRRSASKKTASD